MNRDEHEYFGQLFTHSASAHQVAVVWRRAQNAATPPLKFSYGGKVCAQMRIVGGIHRSSHPLSRTMAAKSLTTGNFSVCNRILLKLLY
jgi:hypothetical protein